MKLVSIVIPSYNSEAYIKEAVDSALTQTYPDCEIIVVDDGSTDKTREILEPYVRDGNIIYIYQANKGLSGARNTGIRAARGAYVAFLDSDDIFMPEKIAKQVAAIEAHPDYGVCYCDITHFSDTEPRTYFHHRYRYVSGNLLPAILHKQFVNPLTLLVRREVFDMYGFFDEHLRRSEDWDLWLRWSHAGVKFYYLDEQLAYYRVRVGGNLSSLQSEPTMKEKNLELFERFGKTLTREEWHDYNFQSILDKLALKVVFAYLMIGKKPEALARSKKMPFGIRLIIAIVPRKIWELLLVAWREVKHRMLLRRI